MTVEIPPFILALIGSVVRHGVTVVCGALITAGYLTDDQQGQLIQCAIGAAGILAAVAWSWVQKKNATIAALVAAAAPAGTTQSEVNARIALANATGQALPSVMTMPGNKPT